MRRVRAMAVGVVATGVVMAAYACGPRQVATPAPAGVDLVVLLPDPDGGTIGRAAVTSAGVAVDLVSAHDSTRMVANQPPTPAVTMDEAEVQRIFGEALSTLPPQPRVFNLYFQFESDVLTDESRSAVPEILRVVAARPVPDVVAIGHTDTTGNTASNFGLGLKRATRIRDLLVEAGLDTALIEVMSLGESSPLIKTADETPEPRNRRVEIAVR